MELAVAIIALAVTLWQLKQQRDESRRNSEISALIHFVTLLRERIDYHERIIEDLKQRRADWSGHAARVNNELRPLLTQVHARLLLLVGRDSTGIDADRLRAALKLDADC